MGVDDEGGYISNSSSNKNRVKTIVQEAIDNGLYVIIDWHSHHAEKYLQEAIGFFLEMAQLYEQYDNVIYNEPLNVSCIGSLNFFYQFLFMSLFDRLVMNSLYHSFWYPNPSFLTGKNRYLSVLLLLIVIAI